MALPYKHVLAPTDFSSAAAVGLTEAVALADAFGARLTVVHVYDIPGYAYAGVGVGYMTTEFLISLRETAEKLLADALTAVRAQCPRAESLLRQGSSWDQVLAAARDLPAHVIVMSTHGRTGLSHALIGSVAEKVVRLAAVPVLTVPARGSK